MNMMMEMLNEHERLQKILRYAILLKEGEPVRDIKVDLNLTNLQAYTTRRAAIESGIINIKVYPPRDKAISGKLQKKYKLREARAYYIGIREEITRYLGQVSAEYLEELLDDPMKMIRRVAIGPGIQMSALVSSLSDKQRDALTVCSTTSSTGIETNLASNVNIGIPVDKWKCKNRRFDHRMSSDEKKKYIKGIDLMILGIDPIDDIEGVTALSLMAECNINKSDLGREFNTLAGKEYNGAAFINYQPIDEDGEIINWNLKEYKTVLPTLIELDIIKKMAEDEDKMVICVAGGSNSVDAIRAGIKGRYFNVLITDYDTAVKL